MKDAPSQSPLLISSEGRALVRLNRPQHRNRLEPADIDAFLHILARIEEDAAVRVLVLTGSGATFCAGYDLRSLSNGEATNKHRRGSVHDFEQLVDRLEACRVPTICALNGPAYGGGADLALACDFRVGISTADLAIPAGDLGVHYYHGGLRRFVTRLGHGTAVRLFLLSQSIDAAEMLRVGFLQEVVPTLEALQARINAITDALVAAPAPAVIDGMKRTLNRIAQGDLDSEAANAAWIASIASPSVALAAAQRLAARRQAANESSHKG